MKKLLLCAFIALSTLTSCSNDETETTNVDNSFSRQIVEVKGYDKDGVYQSTGYDKAVTENSKIIYNEIDKTIKVTVSSEQVYNIVSTTENVYYSTTKIAGTTPELILNVKIYIQNGNIIFEVTKADNTFLAKLEYIVK